MKTRNVRTINGSLYEDNRQHYVFEYMNGRMVSTKAVSAEEALAHIRHCLGLPAEKFELMREAA